MADKVGDRVAVKIIMGHAGNEEVTDEYMEQSEDFPELQTAKVDRKRLLRIVKHVRRWLLWKPPTEKANQATAEASDSIPLRPAGG